ncbi:L,D-transpeptidase family protein [Erythrobacter sp. F6033]|uniref:L,D-transpeptidase family protein n=1 Tax=Erythrobacter sp. F6033 TaxID=2926401 RepID=UPI001FF6A9DC|nr:L,D-transpeptidase family protein [Erythrobacter sp. F6033]MCK0128971.1 L,D-transpeptidase family protein [Erythrobacter sp. F6033]
MERAVAFLLLVTLAGCSSPANETVNAPVSEPRVAARSIPDYQPNRPAARVLADYLIVDKSERLLVAYSNGQPIRAYRGIQFGDAPMGHKRFEGDERTPEGIYTIDTRNPRSSYHLSLRISYPNTYDRAFAAQYGRSPGGDIFIHGQPTGYRGPPLQGDWTDGCIALTNEEIEELWSIVPDGTPIEIRR